MRRDEQLLAKYGVDIKSVKNPVRSCTPWLLTSPSGTGLCMGAIDYYAVNRARSTQEALAMR